MMCFAPRLGVFFANWIVINKQNPESDAVRIIKHQWFCASYPCLGGGQKLSKLVAMRNDPPSFLLKKIEYQVEPGYWAVEEETGEEDFESLFAEDDFWVNWSQRFAAILDAVFLMGHPANDCPAVKGRDVSFQRWGAHRHEYHESCCLAQVKPSHQIWPCDQCWAVSGAPNNWTDSCGFTLGRLVVDPWLLLKSEVSLKVHQKLDSTLQSCWWSGIWLGLSRCYVCNFDDLSKSYRDLCNGYVRWGLNSLVSI